MNEKNIGEDLAWLPHLLGLLVGFIGPLVTYFISKNDCAFVAAHSKSAFNWQMSLFIYYIICIPLCFLLVGYLILFALVVLNLVFSIIAMVRASNKEEYRYKFSICFLK